ncbi:hypothetical protein EOD42_22390 [Rhodovarius crocodyli]|uniref:LysM domain-containing protein n=1 Tax=Rhodovarius crocodyli TaxID=1979269 RepID=A0A437M149_9PROT|nr:hypothetical protein [Rhodovarius crocodyli]RVT91407.1 hypothetical protein EOD42_22390 [Rhodovarius crocodyli]
MSGSYSTTRYAAGWRFVAIRHGDTLQALALRHLGSASRWADLASLNDLVPPYLSGDPAEVTASGGRVLAYGASIRVFAASATADAQTDPEEVFLTDLALVAGRLTVENGDYGTVSGMENFKASLARRLSIELGELPFHPSYGCAVRSIIGSVNGPTGAALAGRAVRRALLQDPRVQEVGRVVVSAAGHRAPIEASVTPIGSAAVTTISAEA